MDQERTLRSRILQKAFSLFLSRGFTRVTTQDIASALGISKKTLYKHYSSKHEIVSIAIDQNLQGLGSRLDAIIAQDDWSFNRKFTNVLMLIQQMVGGITEIFLEDMARHIPDVWEQIDTFRRNHVLGVLNKLLLQGQQEGEVRKNLDIDAVLFILFGTIQHIITPDKLLNAGFTPGKILSIMIDVFYTGILTPHGSAEFKQNKDVLPAQELDYEEKFFID